MSLLVTESEMIERFLDGLKKASSTAKEFVTAEEKDKPKLFVKFIDSVKVSAGSSHQLALQQENTHFLDLRDLLEDVIEASQSLTVFSGNQGPLWTMISTSLDQMAERGRKLATSKAMKRVDVLANLNLREAKARLDG